MASRCRSKPRHHPNSTRRFPLVEASEEEQEPLPEARVEVCWGCTISSNHPIRPTRDTIRINIRCIRLHRIITCT